MVHALLETISFGIFEIGVFFLKWILEYEVENNLVAFTNCINILYTCFETISFGTFGFLLLVACKPSNIL